MPWRWTFEGSCQSHHAYLLCRHPTYRASRVPSCNRSHNPCADRGCFVPRALYGLFFQFSFGGDFWTTYLPGPCELYSMHSLLLSFLLRDPPRPRLFLDSIALEPEQSLVAADLTRFPAVITRYHKTPQLTQTVMDADRTLEYPHFISHRGLQVICHRGLQLSYFPSWLTGT